MKPTSRSKYLKLVPLIITLCALHIARPAGASYSVNGAGFGTATVDVWCFPNSPPAAPSYTSTIGGVFFPSPSLGPGLLGCNPKTAISLGTRAAAALFGARITHTEGGGDATGYADVDLLPLVTPTSPLSMGMVDMVGDIVSSTSVLFTGSWFGSDAGVAERLEFFDISNPSSPRLLLQDTEVGPFSKSINFLISGITNVSGTSDELRANLRVIGEGIGTSVVPEPATLALLGVGLAGLGISRRRKLGTDH